MFTMLEVIVLLLGLAVLPLAIYVIIQEHYENYPNEPFEFKHFFRFVEYEWVEVEED